MEQARALVFGRPDPVGLESVQALVVAEAGTGTEDVLRFCRGRLAEYKLPRRVTFVDRIPENEMGKNRYHRRVR